MIYANSSDVAACYRLLLGREPDPQGLKVFLDYTSGGNVPVTDLAFLFLSSPEFLSIQQARQQDAQAIERVQLDRFQMDVAPAWNGINRQIATTRSYEPYVTREMVNILAPGKTFVDVGANIGYFSLLASSCGAQVRAFEPAPRNVWLLMRNARLNDFHIEVFPYAVSDSERLMIYSSVEGNGQIGPFADRLIGPGQELIRTATLDKALQGWPVDIMKLDIEGAESLALQGATSILERRPVLFLEFSPAGLEVVSQIPPLEFLKFLVSWGYSLAVIDEIGARNLPPDEILSTATEAQGGLLDLIATPAG
jgi:FkbM family methyltransferase